MVNLRNLGRDARYKALLRKMKLAACRSNHVELENVRELSGKCWKPGGALGSGAGVPRGYAHSSELPECSLSEPEAARARATEIIVRSTQQCRKGRVSTDERLNGTGGEDTGYRDYVVFQCGAYAGLNRRGVFG